MPHLRPLARALTCALSSVVLAASAGAQTTVTFLGSPTNANDGTYLVGPFGMTMQSGVGVAQSVTAFCADFLNRVEVGQTWTANVTGLGDVMASLADTRHPMAMDAAAMTKYRTAAWLASQFAANPTAWSELQHALWNVWTPGSFAANAWDAAAAQAASTNFAGVTFADWAVVSDVAGRAQAAGGAQEFLVWNAGIGAAATTVPEPATLTLLGAGLAGLVVTARRRRA